jgi:ubiquinone/menaquinone biosynthesis C-methylase UbiE
VACGAGFLACAFAAEARWVDGIDLSRRMLQEAAMLARTRCRDNVSFCQADAEALPFRPAACDLVTSKLAIHYFPRPQIALAEMVRVATPAARLVLIDRISSENTEQRTYQNRIEKLRTLSKTYVYSESELVAALERSGLLVEARARYPEQMEVRAWVQAAGSDEETPHAILALLTAGGDPAGFQVRRKGDRLMMTHQTIVLVARRREGS